MTGDSNPPSYIELPILRVTKINEIPSFPMLPDVTRYRSPTARHPDRKVSLLLRTLDNTQEVSLEMTVEEAQELKNQVEKLLSTD